MVLSRSIELICCSFVADSQDVDLDAILGELCALERRCDGDIASTPAPDSQRQGRPNSTRIAAGDNTDIGKNEGGLFIKNLIHLTSFLLFLPSFNDSSVIIELSREDSLLEIVDRSIEQPSFLTKTQCGIEISIFYIL